MLTGRRATRSPALDREQSTRTSTPPGRNERVPDATPEPEPEDAAEEVVPVEPEPESALKKGTQVGQWVVEERIGALQRCELLRVRHRNSKRIHATLKVADPDDDTIRAELIREGETLFPLDHPNIVTVRNLMLDHDPPFLEMEALKGERLDHMLARRKAVYMAEALDLTEQILGVLDYLHSRDIFHRDLQPSNIIVGPDGTIRLLGFGHAAENPAPEPALPVGDAAYLPPEWPDSPRPGLADLYATGSILYHLLTGQRPFGAPSGTRGLTIAAGIDAKQSTPFLDPGHRFREDLRSLVRHLTRKEPSGRLSDARDALHRIQQAERGYAT